MADRPPRLIDQVRHALRIRHYSPRTESAYVHWILRYIRFHGIRHPNEMGAPEVSAFLTYLAVEGNVAPSTQNQALNALAFLYGPVLERPLGELAAVTPSGQEAPDALDAANAPEERRQIRENRSNYEDVLARESEDPAGSDEAFDHIEEALELRGTHEVRLSDASCAQSVCRFEFDNPEAAERGLMELPQLLPTQGSGMWFTNETSPETVVLFAYRAAPEPPPERP